MNTRRIINCETPIQHELVPGVELWRQRLTPQQDNGLEPRHDDPNALRLPLTSWHPQRDLPKLVCLDQHDVWACALRFSR